MGGLAATLDKVTAELPMKEAVRYKKGNLKWTRADVKKHSEALSCGLLELGCKVGFKSHYCAGSTVSLDTCAGFFFICVVVFSSRTGQRKVQ